MGENIFLNYFLEDLYNTQINFVLSDSGQQNAKSWEPWIWTCQAEETDTKVVQERRHPLQGDRGDKTSSPHGLHVDPGPPAIVATRIVSNNNSCDVFSAVYLFIWFFNGYKRWMVMVWFDLPAWFASVETEVCFAAW